MTPFKSSLVAAIALALPTLVLAQSSPSGPPGPGPGLRGDPTARHQAMCTQQFTGTADRLSALEARLKLTDTQRPAWEKWKQVVTDNAAKGRDACQGFTPTPGARPTLEERQDRMEKMLSLHLDALRAERPALQDLYAQLTPEQKTILDTSAGAGWGRRGGMRGGGMMGGGMMGGGMMGSRGGGWGMDW